MRSLTRLTVIVGLTVLIGACQKPAVKAAKKEEVVPAAVLGSATEVTPQPQQDRGQLAPPMDVSTPPEDAVKTESGMHYKVLAEGSGERPGVNDTVVVHFSGWRTNGELFFSTRDRGSPLPMSLTRVMPGWAEALRDMKVGGRRLYWMPPKLASGDSSMSGGDAFLVFEVQISAIEPGPPVPADVAAAPAGALKTQSGVAYKVIEKGTGTESPRPWDEVTIHFTAWTADGRMLDSTSIAKRPVTMQLFHESKKGWVEVIQTMVVGQKVRAWIPENLLDSRPEAPSGGVTMEFQLVDMKKMNNPPPVPEDVAAPPKDAKQTAKGVFYKVLKQGTGTEKPTAAKTVKVHYTGWTTDGRMFDSSIMRGKPAEFPLRAVIPGWTDGLQVMVVGETTRFWIPEELAYAGRAGAPQGMLVFDVELLEILGAP